MILSTCCKENDKRGLIRRKLLYSTLCELRFNSFSRQLKKESEWQVLFVAIFGCFDLRSTCQCYNAPGTNL
jgi:hypothetical protein